MPIVSGHIDKAEGIWEWGVTSFLNLVLVELNRPLHLGLGLLDRCNGSVNHGAVCMGLLDGVAQLIILHLLVVGVAGHQFLISLLEDFDFTVLLVRENIQALGADIVCLVRILQILQLRVQCADAARHIGLLALHGGGEHFVLSLVVLGNLLGTRLLSVVVFALLAHHLVGLAGVCLSTGTLAALSCDLIAELLNLAVLARDRVQVGFVDLLEVAEALVHVLVLDLESFVGALGFFGAGSVQATFASKARDFFLEIMDNTAGLSSRGVADGGPFSGGFASVRVGACGRVGGVQGGGGRVWRSLKTSQST